MSARRGVRRPRRTGTCRLPCRARLRVAVEGRADVTAVAARRGAPGAGADGPDLARALCAGTRYAGRLPPPDGPRLLLGRVPLGFGRLAGRGPLRVGSGGR